MKEDDATQRNDVLRRLYIATFLCSCFICVEVAGGLISHSLAVLSDAAHLFSDLASFAVAIGASYLASLPATAQHTYGLKRSESLAALFSMVSLAFVSAGLSYEAVRRLIEPPETGVDGLVMTAIAFIGVLVNLVLAWVLGGDHHHLPSHGHDHSHDHGAGGHSPHDHDDHHDDEDPHHHDDHHNGDDHSHDRENSCNSHHDSNDHGTAAGHDHHHNHHADETTPLKAMNGDHHNHDEHDHEEHHHDDSHEHHQDDHDDDDDHNGPNVDQRNVNLRAAYLHVMSDLAQSVAVFVGGLCIWWKPQYHIIDPILTLLFCVLVLYNAFGVLRSSVAVLLEEIPSNVDWKEVYDAISAIPNVEDVHDLHIWSISHGEAALSVHCTSPDPHALIKVTRVCARFGIKHATIQIQPKEGPCPSCQNDCCTSHLSSSDEY